MYRNTREPFGHSIGRIGGETQFEQGKGGHVEPGHSRAAVDEHRDAHCRAACLADDVQALNDAAPASHNVLDDQDGLAGGQGEAAPHHQDIILLFRENIAGAGLAGDLLANDEATHGGSQYRGEFESGCPQAGDEQFGESLHGIHALANLGALEVVAAVQAGSEHKMPLQQGAGAREDIEDFLLALVHAGTLGFLQRKENEFCVNAWTVPEYRQNVTPALTLSLEDEIGDVLEKGMRRAGLTEQGLALQAGVSPERLRDVLDYRGGLETDELCRLAAVLGLNEVGVCALGAGKYPAPPIGALPFCVWPLRMPHGIGVANAYLVGECGSSRAILFDTGAGLGALESVWPASVSEVDAVFLTHVEQEHAGGLCGVVERFRVPVAYAPEGVTAPCGVGMGEGDRHSCGRLSIRAFSTPGHVAAHNCYLVDQAGGGVGGSLLISGDLIFAGSVGGAYFSHAKLQESVRRMLQTVPAATVIAPGHGPMTTAGHELRYNPFCGFV